jgi:hypothetical protein
MDSGMNASSVLTLDERIEQSKIPLDSSLSVPQLIGVMDQLLAREVSYQHSRLVSSLTHVLFLGCMVWGPFSCADSVYLSLHPSNHHLGESVFGNLL